MKVTVTFDPTDKREVFQALDTIAPRMIHTDKAYLVKCLREYVKRFTDGNVASQKDLSLFVDGRFPSR